MSAFAIKIIAFIFMLGDHLQVLFPHAVPIWVRYLGRFSFPVFAYFTSVGMKKTHSREKYMFRLFCLAAVTEIPYDLCFGQPIDFLDKMNIVWTLLWGAAVIYVLTVNTDKILRALYALCLLTAGCFLGLDYGVYGVLLITAYYFFPEKRQTAAATVFIFTIKWLGYIYPFGFFTLFWFFSCLGFALPCLYNGEKGKEPKYMFYFLYLGHILVLLAVKGIIEVFT
ncbi:MAG: conjugal transfer protein TraX [Clostridiales bacterium]|nr:conjugal transfer protein TraX [Clostridiales bacterium]